MTKSTRLVALSSVAVLLIAAAWYLIALGPGPAWEAVLKRLSPEAESTESPKAPVPSASPARHTPKAGTKEGTAARGERSAGSVAAAGETPAGPATSAPMRAASVTAPASPQPRKNVYLPGQRTVWTLSDVIVEAPMRLRAGGQVADGEDRSGPDGLSGSAYERSLARRRSSPETDARVLPSAPYLSLIGRVCSGEECSAPFLIGSGTVVCPSDLHLTGKLQIWTNNYTHVDGAATATRFSGTTGGFWLYTEPAPAEACGVRSSTATSEDAAILASGGVLRKPEFSISASQTNWKPFFLPMREPLLIRASGEMQPGSGVTSTGPDGIVVPDVPSWNYPGTTAVVVDDEHKLFDSRLPYQALIGRVCAVTECGPPFLVGREQVICPQAAYGDHLQLWINHIIGPRGLLGGSTTLTIETFDLQTRRGEYRFEISSAPGRCGK